MSVRLRVNGAIRDVEAAPDTPLLLVLRNDLGLVGAKYGCGEQECGACAVLIDGREAPACGVTIGEVGTKAITTLEGLGTAEKLHPLQAAFLAEQAAQCGYCTSGMIVAAKDLLDRAPRPSEAQVRARLAGHLCRCGSHERIVRAVLRAAETMRADAPRNEPRRGSR